MFYGSLESFVFIEFNILIFIVIYRQKRKNLNPGPAPAIQLAPHSEPPPPIIRRRKPQNSWVIPWILQREERGYFITLPAHLIQTDIPGYQNFVRMPPAGFDLIAEHIQKVKSSKSEYYNYKGFFSLVLGAWLMQNTDSSG